MAGIKTAAIAASKGGLGWEGGCVCSCVVANGCEACSCTERWAGREFNTRKLWEVVTGAPEETLTAAPVLEVPLICVCKLAAL